MSIEVSQIHIQQLTLEMKRDPLRRSILDIGPLGVFRDWTYLWSDFGQMM